MDAQSIDALLANAAATGKVADHELLFAALKGVELFFNVTTTGPGNQAASTPLVKVGPSLHAVLVCTFKDSDKLTRPFGGIIWERALQMVMSMPRADGLVIQGAGAAWVGLDRAKVESLLKAVS